MIQNKLIDKFGNHINHMSCVYPDKNGEKRLREMCQKINPRRTVLEIGTYQGVSACIMSEYFDKVLTIDIKRQDLTNEIIDFCGCTEKISNYVIGDRKEEKSLVDKLCKDNDLDMIFIDGEHTHYELSKDWDMLNSKCSSILIHDYDPYYKDVYDFVNKIEGWEKQVNGSFVLLRKGKNTIQEKPKKRGRKKKVDK